MTSSAPTAFIDTIELPAPETKQRFNLTFSTRALAGWTWNGTVIRGAHDGPRLALISGVHPTEYPAIEANIRLTRQIDPGELHGTIVSLPIIDVPAFYTRSPFVCPIDGKNPNRFFPGDPNGTFTDIMDDAIFRAVIAPSDALVDLHGGDLVEALEPFAIYAKSGNVEVDAASEAMGLAMGLPYLIEHTPTPGALGGMTVQAASAAGIPAILPEAGGCGLLTEPETGMLVDGVMNVLRHFGMLSEPARDMPQPKRITEFTWLFAPVEGMWYPAVRVGERVRDGQTIGRVANLYGDDLAQVTAPHDGDVLFITTSPAMKESGILLAVGRR